MKKRFSIIFLVLLFSASFAATDYKTVNTDREACYKVMTSQCFSGLMNKYSSAPKQIKNILRYDYAVALISEQEYSKARENLKTVLFRETENKQLIKLANERIEQLNEINRKIASANNMDSGNYYKSKERKAIWQNHYNIKVYIASNVGKESLIKTAFRVWDEKMFKTINFSYVDNENDADITIKFVNSLSDNAAGVTKYSKAYSDGSKTYLKKVNIEIALTNPSGGKYTDTNLTGIILHEIGHALGITYHSDNKNDIMYYSVESYKNSTISHRDINTLEQIYR